MCLYARTDFKCGDWRWGNMKQRCPRQPRIGETCGAKLPDTDNLKSVDDLCKTCQEITVKTRRLQREKNNIKRWSLEGDKFQASIERAHRDVRQLKEAIADLEKCRSSKLFNNSAARRDPGSISSALRSRKETAPRDDKAEVKQRKEVLAKVSDPTGGVSTIPEKNVDLAAGVLGNETGVETAGDRDSAETYVRSEATMRRDTEFSSSCRFYQEPPSSLDGSPLLSETSDLVSSGEESFILGDDYPPFLDGETWRQVDAIAPALGQELALEFLSCPRSTTTRAPSNTQVSSIGSSPDGCRAAAVGSSTGPTSATMQNNGRANDNEEDDAHKRKGPRLEKAGSDEPDSDGLLACPYVKHDPARYSEANRNLSEKAYRRCRTALTNIARLKQHLYRVHRQPEYHCSSCYMEFATENECSIHSRSRICPLRESPFEEKMTSDQCKAIKRRRMREAPTDAWFAIYGILFPEADRPDNPHVEGTSTQATIHSVQDYTAFLENRLPLRLSERLGGPLFGAEPMMFQWLINMALEETLPIVLQELQGEYQTLRPAENGNVDPFEEDVALSSM